MKKINKVKKRKCTKYQKQNDLSESKPLKKKVYQVFHDDEHQLHLLSQKFAQIRLILEPWFPVIVKNEF